MVDPGVGPGRRRLYAEIAGHHFLAPDNGLLSRLARAAEPFTIIHLNRPQHGAREVSPTFHGRDILAPVAARLVLGTPPAELGDAAGDGIKLDGPEVQIMPGKIEGTVARVDSLGNLVTDIPAEKLAPIPRGDTTVRIVVDEHETYGIFATYADQPELTFMALVSSSGFLELAIVNDNASLMLGIKAGEKVVVTW